MICGKNSIFAPKNGLLRQRWAARIDKLPNCSNSLHYGTATSERWQKNFAGSDIFCIFVSLENILDKLNKMYNLFKFREL